MRIEALTASRDPEKFLDDFCGLPWRVRSSQYRKGLLRPELTRPFLSMSVPFDREFWLCYEGNRVLASVGANVSINHPEAGCLGFLEHELGGETPDDVSLALIASACDWLRARGRKRVFAPLNFNTWFPYRFRLDDGDWRTFEWEPINPPEYVALLEKNGFEIAERYTSTAFGNLPGYLDHMKPAHEKAVASGFTFVPFALSINAKDLDVLYRISIQSFAQNFLFEPISRELFRNLYVEIADRAKQSLSYFVLDSSGTEVGFLYAFLDEWREDSTPHAALILKSIAIVPGVRRRGLSNALSYLSVRDAVALGAKSAVSALVRGGSQSESYARKGEFLWRHEYALWKRNLDPSGSEH